MSLLRRLFRRPKKKPVAPWGLFVMGPTRTGRTEALHWVKGGEVYKIDCADLEERWDA